MSKTPSNRILIIGLIVIVVIIWLNLFFRIFRATTEVTLEVAQNIPTMESKTVVDTFSVRFSGVVKDPFRIKTNNNPTIIQPKQEVAKECIIPPKIAYKGMIGKTAIVFYKNETYIVELKQEIDDWIVKSISKDKLEIEYQKEVFEYELTD